MTTVASNPTGGVAAQMLPDGLELGAPQLAVADLGRSLAFYRDLLGLRVISSDETSAMLGAGDGQGAGVIELVAQPGAQRPARRAAGLYHVAILLPSQRELARTMMRLLQAGTRIAGASDHLVSEAFYLDDPDGNGLELYRDRPRSEWPMRGAQVVMDTLPIDIEAFFAVLRGDSEPWTGIAAGTRIGHMHLRVNDVAAATRFYRDVVGFAVMASMPSAAFVAVNGYHHHLGMNEWESRGGPPAAPSAAGLRFSRFSLPAQSDLDALRGRLQAAGVAVEGDDGAISFADPSGNRWVVVVAD